MNEKTNYLSKIEMTVKRTYAIKRRLVKKKNKQIKSYKSKKKSYFSSQSFLCVRSRKRRSKEEIEVLRESENK